MIKWWRVWQDGVVNSNSSEEAATDEPLRDSLPFARRLFHLGTAGLSTDAPDKRWSKSAPSTVRVEDRKGTRCFPLTKEDIRVQVNLCHRAGTLTKFAFSSSSRNFMSPKRSWVVRVESKKFNRFKVRVQCTAPAQLLSYISWPGIGTVIRLKSESVKHCQRKVSPWCSSVPRFCKMLPLLYSSSPSIQGFFDCSNLIRTCVPQSEDAVAFAYTLDPFTVRRLASKPTSCSISRR